jgi:hypothetical protein
LFIGIRPAPIDSHERQAVDLPTFRGCFSRHSGTFPLRVCPSPAFSSGMHVQLSRR